MKISKVWALVASSFVIFSVAFAATTKTIDFDLKHAVQRIWWQVDIQTESWLSGERVASLKQEYAKLRIVSKGDGNFLLFTGNRISSGSFKSNVLWWNANELWNTSISAEGSTIIAGNDNRNFSDFSVIWWWSENQISSWRWNVIAWWSDNQINEWAYSVIVWGSNNEVKWENSVTVWVNNAINWNSSVALWSWALIIWANNSFLWTDNGAELGVSDVFAVMWERWMVINANAAHDLAQLTVGWSIVVWEWSGDNNIQCNSSGKWIIKLVDKVWDQKCLCSCNWSNWDSLLWDGQCKSICNGSDSITAVCGSELAVIVGEDWKRQYSWSCNSWSVVEGSYYVSNTNVWWTCQEANGSVDMCSLTLWCTWRIPENGHANNNISPSGEYEYTFSNSVWDICTYSCDPWYAHYGTGCEQICKYDTMWWSCYFGERLPSEGTRTNSYTYSCRYDDFDYKCSTSCPTDYVWAWDSGSLTGCQQQVSACSETTKYVCNLWTPYTWRVDLDDENDLYFRWECVDAANNTIWGTGCKLAKPVESRDVYYDKQEVTAGMVISFRMTGAIETWVEIKLHKTNQTETFIITWGETRSAGKTYTQNTSSYYARFQNGETTTNVIMPTKVYSLKLVDWTVTANLCATTCAKAWTCLYWSTSSAFASWINWNTAIFSWTCRSWSIVDTWCKATCNIKSWSCTSVPTNGISCDANQNGCAPLKWASINLRNFYLDAAWNVTSNGSGYRQHCVFSGWKIDCVDATNPYPWSGWKCNSWFTMDVSSCSCEGWSACNSSIYSGLCTYWTTTLWGATYTSGYTYWCASSSETCNAKCGTWKVWAWGTLKCIDSTGLCTDEDSSHACNYWSERKYLSWGVSSHAWEWKCERWEISKICHHCLTWYTRNGTQCSATSVNCESTWIILNSVNYTVPVLNHNASTGVAWRNSIKFCTATASCSNWVASLTNVNCTNACWTWPSDTPKCNTWSVYSKDWITYKSSYGYYCKDGTWMSTKCSINCNSGKYWNWTQCVTAPTVCSWAHYNCIAPWQLVAWSTNYVINGANYVYSWNCGTWDIVKPCSQTTVNTWAYNCSGTTISDYTIPPLNNNGTTTVEKFTNVWQCTATAKCRTGVVSLYNENCPAIVACNGSWGCNLWTPGWYDWATYSNSYNYKCYGEGITWSCIANCPSGKVWNGTQCVNNEWWCLNDNHYNCAASTPYNTSEVTKWYYWDCKDWDGNKLNTDRCYECKSWYVYSWTAWACVGKELSCSWVRPEHSIWWISSYTYSWTIHSWTKTSGTLWLCKYKCDEHYNSWDNCNPEIVACSWLVPTSNVTKWSSTYLYNWSEKTWTSVTYSVLGSCQFRCDTWSIYNSSTNTCDSVCAPSSIPACKWWFTALPSSASWNTYYTCNGYNCNCDEKIWNGSRCIDTPDTLCIVTSIDGGCNSSNKSDLVKYDNNAWSTWKCKNGVAEENCYYCSQHYHWDSSLNKCVWDTLNCSWSAPTSNVTKWSSSYTYSWTIRNWTNITSWTPWLCQFKCNNYYHRDPYVINCLWNTLSCSWSVPTSNVMRWSGSYTYSWTIRNWTNITSWTPWLCQFKCNTWSTYSGGNCVSAGKCWSANGVRTSSMPSSNLCSGGTASAVTAVRCGEEQVCWRWTCSGSSVASCSADIPTATFDRCRSSWLLTVAVYKDMWWNYDNVNFYGVDMFDDDHYETFNSTGQTGSISSPDISSIYEIKWNGGVVGDWFMKWGYILLPGSRDGNLCPVDCSQYSYANRWIVSSGNWNSDWNLKRCGDDFPEELYPSLNESVVCWGVTYRKCVSDDPCEFYRDVLNIRPYFITSEMGGEWVLEKLVMIPGFGGEKKCYTNADVRYFSDIEDNPENVFESKLRCGGLKTVFTNQSLYDWPCSNWQFDNGSQYYDALLYSNVPEGTECVYEDGGNEYWTVMTDSRSERWFYSVFEWTINNTTIGDWKTLCCRNVSPQWGTRLWTKWNVKSYRGWETYSITPWFDASPDSIYLQWACEEYPQSNW